MIRVYTDGPLLLLEFDDGRQLSALIASKAMATKLAEVANLDIDSLVTDDDLRLVAKLDDLKSLADTSDLDALSGRLENLSDLMQSLDIVSLNVLSELDLTTLTELINNPERFQGEDGRDGVDGEDGNTGRDGIRGDLGFQGRDGRDGRDGSTGEKGDQGDSGTAGVSVVDAYFNLAGELVFQLSQGMPEINTGQIPDHSHDSPVDSFDDYEKAKLELNMRVGTGWTLPNIDRAVQSAKDNGITDFDSIVQWAIAEL